MVIRKNSLPETRRGPHPVSVLDSNSDVVQKRLARIAANYELVDQLLDEMETRMPGDPDAARRIARPR